MLGTSRRLVLFTLLMVFVSGSVYVGLVYNRLAGGSNVDRPHIIVIVADDLGWNDVSFHGADQIPTPNIDALAYNGVILQRHYVLPTCTPSRTAFLTGRYPIRTGMQGYPLRAGEQRAIPLENKLMPEYLGKLGYRTHLIGKWHVGYYTDRHTPAGRGFDTFFGYYNGYVQYFNHTITQNNHTGHDLHHDVTGKLSVQHSHQYMTDLITEKAEDVISTHDSKQPLYLQLAHVAPHSSDGEETMEVRDMAAVNSTLGHIADINRRKFGGMMTALDESVGRVVAALKRAGMLENSMVVFMADNGAQTQGLLENFGSNYPLRGLKFTLYEGAIRGVACIYSPLIKKSSRISQQLFHVTDWLPTFYSAAGGDPGDLEGLDGVDQWPVIVSGEKTKRRGVLLNIDEVANTSAALIGRYKLMKEINREYSDYYGDDGTSDAYPAYNVTNVLRSLAGSAIASISRPALKIGKAVQLRKRAKVSCERFTDYAKCSDRCLFDVRDDPCESTDLSARYPEIVEELSAYIDRYRTVLMNQTNANVDPAGFPEHFNGTWMPWIKYESSFQISR